MKILFLVLASILWLKSCNVNKEQGIKGDGNVVSKEIAIADYSGIDVSEWIEVIYEQKADQAPYLRIEIDKNLQPYIIAEVKNRVLVLGKSEENISPSVYKVYTNSTALNSVRKSGSSNVLLKGIINADELEVKSSDSGILTIENLTAKKFKGSISGSDNFHLSGTTYLNELEISGSGTIDASKFKAKNASCNISGSGKVIVYASDTLLLNVSGSGNIVYKDFPLVVEKQISGSGTITAE